MQIHASGHVLKFFYTFPSNVSEGLRSMQAECSGSYQPVYAACVLLPDNCYWRAAAADETLPVVGPLENPNGTILCWL